MKKRFLSLIIALAMMVGVFTPLIASAEETTLEQTTASVTVHKILQTADNMKAKNAEGKDVFPGTKGIDGTEYDGNEIAKSKLEGYFGEGSKEIAGVYFVWTNNQDQVINSKGETIKKDNKEITITDNKLPKEVTKDDLSNALAGETTATGYKATTSELPAGTYKIYEIHRLSSYKADGTNTLTEMRAVPVTITLPLNDVVDAHVYPKNTEDKPQIDKNFQSKNGLETIEDNNKNKDSGAEYENATVEKAKAKAEIGKKIPYEVKTQIPAQSKYEKVKWTDSMTDGLTFNNDIQIEADNGVTFGTGDYTIVADNHGFTLSLTDAGLKKIQNKDSVTNITLKYTATVNADAKIDSEEINDVKFDYGNKPGKDIKPTETTPKNGEIKVEKSWAVDGNAVTEADKNVKAVFILQEKDGDNWKDVESYTATIAEKFTHTFTGLYNEKTYRVIERVSGYEPEYVTRDDNGTIEIKNTKDSTNPKPLDPTEPKVVVGGRKFVKADQTDGTRLQGAEFIVKKTVKDGDNNKDLYLKEKDKKNIQELIAAYKAADKAYKDAVAKLTQKDGVITYPEGVTAETIKGLKEARDKAFEAANITYEWVATKEDAAKFISNEKGQVEIYGIEYGKNYTLVETKAPAGYGTPTNADFKFEVANGSYTADAEGVVYEGTDKVVDKAQGADAMRINNKKVTIPQTGGIGTVIFTAIGLAIMASAIIAIKKRQATEAR